MEIHTQNQKNWREKREKNKNYGLQQNLQCWDPSKFSASALFHSSMSLLSSCHTVGNENFDWEILLKCWKESWWEWNSEICKCGAWRVLFIYFCFSHHFLLHTGDLIGWEESWLKRYRHTQYILPFFRCDSLALILLRISKSALTQIKNSPIQIGAEKQMQPRAVIWEVTCQSKGPTALREQSKGLPCKWKGIRPTEKYCYSNKIIPGNMDNKARAVEMGGKRL